MDNDTIKFKMATSNIAMLNRIFEGYEHIGVVSTIDCQFGLVSIRSTPDMLPEACLILHHLPFPVDIICSEAVLDLSLKK